LPQKGTAARGEPDGKKCLYVFT